MNHSFNLAIANEFGLNVATFLQSIAFWTHNNLTNKRNIIDGHCWTYNSLAALQETFTYWTKRQLETVIKHAIEAGLLIKGNYNQTRYDRTVWYALTMDAYKYFPSLNEPHFMERLSASLISPECEMDRTNVRNGSNENVTPIPDTHPVTDPNINIIIDDCRVSDDEIVAAYHEELPSCPKIKVVDSKLRRQLSHMRRLWPKYQKDGNHFTLESFRNYLCHIRSYYPWFIMPYTTSNGNLRQNNLRVITREINISKIVNGEFGSND